MTTKGSILSVTYLSIAPGRGPITYQYEGQDVAGGLEGLQQAIREAEPPPKKPAKRAARRKKKA